MSAPNEKDKKNLVEGSQFGRLTYLGPDPDKKYFGLFKCSCPKNITKSINLYTVLDGSCLSCGCIKRDMHNAKSDLKLGQKIGDLTVVKRVADRVTKSGVVKSRFECICDFGHVVQMNNNSLRPSCKCKVCNSLGEKNSNYRHGMADNTIDRRYYNMVRRCTIEECDEYHNYGGRGITICEEWLEDKKLFFNWFLDEMKDCGFTMEMLKDQWIDIDREDNDGDYTPDNCRLVSRKVNANNTRNNLILYVFGEHLTMASAVEKYGGITCAYGAFRHRKAEGWDIERALITYINPKYKMKPANYDQPLTEEEREAFLIEWRKENE